MGCYDTVHVGCPSCGERNEIQTKSGDCTLSDYSLGTAPVDVLAGVSGVHYCKSCSKSFYIKISAHASVHEEWGLDEDWE